MKQLMSGEFSHVPKAPSCSESSEKNNHAESDSDDIISDPRLQKAIEDFDVGIRDQVRREYLAKGLYQLIGLNFLQKEYGKQRRRSFLDAWFKHHP